MPYLVEFVRKFPNDWYLHQKILIFYVFFEFFYDVTPYEKSKNLTKNFFQ